MHSLRIRLLICLAAALWLASFSTLSAFTLPAGFSEVAVGSDWTEPVGVAFDPSPDAANRVYVWERAGRVWIVENGVKLPTPLLDISDEVGAWRDHGMLGLALHPNFHQNGYIYVSYVVDRHHLMNAGTPAYNPATNEYFAATIGRITRYTARSANNFTSVDPASRKVLVGETKSTGIPICYQSHGVGQLVFGNDGMLLASCGESSNHEEVDDGTKPNLTYATQALADGIITAKENVGAFRSQLIGSLSGKILRLDPETGNGVVGNPFFLATRPRAAQSRVWALGFRNPFRFTVRPETGSHDPAEADPGVIVLGDVGWGAWEEINVINGPGKNCGWPLFEGLTTHESFIFYSPQNLEAPNPLGGFFKFRDLLVQETRATPSWPNPLNPTRQVPPNVPHFMHTRPVIDVSHLTNPEGPARAATFFDTTAGEILVGAPGSPVAGPQFGANASVGGVFYTGTDFPEQYRGKYFHADFGRGWIKTVTFNANQRATEIADFATGGAPVFLATHPTLGGLYAVDYGTATVFKISYAPNGNTPPTASAAASVTIGASPLSVDFSSAGSTDPDGQPLTYLWNFGDGTTSTLASPTHVFTSGIAKRFDVTLTVTDSANATAQATTQVFVNHTLPTVTLQSPIDGAKYTLEGDTQYLLMRNVVEVPGHPTTTQWNVFLHHNEHQHGEPAVIAPSATALISPIHSLTETYFFRIQLTVTDDLGAKVIRNARLYPNVTNVAPEAAWSATRQVLVMNTSPQIIDAAATLSDTDSAGMEFGKLRFVLGNARAGDVLSVMDEGSGPGQVGAVGNRVLYGGAIVGARSGGTGATPLEIAFTPAATPAAAQAILRRIAGVFPTSGTRTVTATIDDGDGGVFTTGVPLYVRVTPLPNVPPAVLLRRPTDLSTFAAPATIPIVATATDSDGTVSKVEFFSGTEKLGESTIAPFAFVWNGVSAGAYSITARATDNSGATTTSAPIAVTVTGADAAPSPWRSQDIGKAFGMANFGAQTFTIRSAGAGMGSATDELHFLWQPWSGDGELIARVDSLRTVTVQSFAGLMFRESLLPGARQVSLVFQTNSRAFLRWRDGITPTLQRAAALTPALPGWVKLSRQGSVFTGSTSVDGITWTSVGTATVNLPAQCLVGLTASANGGVGARTIAPFSNVTGPRAITP